VHDDVPKLNAATCTPDDEAVIDRHARNPGGGITLEQDHE